MHVVLVRPEIPWNTGNVGRTCVAAGVSLHLVGPLGFSIDDKQLRRAGLDYWPLLDLSVYPTLRRFTSSALSKQPWFFFSRFAKRSIWSIRIPNEAVLIFGNETKGLPPSTRRRWGDRFFRIPMSEGVRSLNLSTAVGIAVFEGLRQQRSRRN